MFLPQRSDITAFRLNLDQGSLIFGSCIEISGYQANEVRKKDPEQEGNWIMYNVVLLVIL